MNARSRWVAGIVIAVLAVLAAILAANWWVLRQSRLHIVKTSAELPLLEVGLVLGTSPRLADGGTNPFFAGRIGIAAQLYRIGSVKHLLVSGDNGKKTYDEPTAMRDALIEAGVPTAAITLDYAGFRTLDSMARAKGVFGLQRVTVVTDDFHLPRAVFLARALGLEAFGFPSSRVPFRWSMKTRAREVLSRVKACLDVYVLHTQPKFLGPPVTLEIAR